MNHWKAFLSDLAQKASENMAQNDHGLHVMRKGTAMVAKEPDPTYTFADLAKYVGSKNPRLLVGSDKRYMHEVEKRLGLPQGGLSRGVEAAKQYKSDRADPAYKLHTMNTPGGRRRRTRKKRTRRAK
jgi:hypothetical protein